MCRCALVLMHTLFLQVVMSTDNLFQRVRVNSKISHAEERNPLHQLEAIGNFVSDLGNILRARPPAKKTGSGPVALL